MARIRNSLRFGTCRCCGSRAIRRVGPIESGTSVSYSSHRIELELPAELWKCSECASAFVQNAVSESDAITLYSSGASGERWKRPPFEETHTQAVLRELRARFGPSRRVLDVGGNTGELLDFARGQGCRTAAVEYSDESRRLLVAKGHEAFRSLADAGGGHDVITAFDLVEHIYDVPAFFAGCREALAPRGILVILTGDVGCLSALLSGERWWYSSYPEHVVFPSRRFLGRVAGFELVRVKGTYASRGYVGGPLAWAMAAKRVLAGAYDGLPAIGPDHTLAVLRRAG